MDKIKFIASYGAKNFGKVLKKNGCSKYKDLQAEYEKRYITYIYSEDWGENNFRLSSYLNMFLGITCCKISMEQGYSFEESIKIFDDLSKGMRKIARRMHLIADAFPNGYKVVTGTLYKDLTTEKKKCWNFEVLEQNEDKFVYKIHQCVYLDTCEKYGIKDFCQVFCDHDIWAYGDLKKHTKFIRHSTLVTGDCCYDEFERVKR